MSAPARTRSSINLRSLRFAASWRMGFPVSLSKYERSTNLTRGDSSNAVKAAGGGSVGGEWMYEWNKERYDAFRKERESRQLSEIAHAIEHKMLTINGSNNLFSPGYIFTCLAITIPETVIDILLFQQKVDDIDSTEASSKMKRGCSGPRWMNAIG